MKRLFSLDMSYSSYSNLEDGHLSGDKYSHLDSTRCFPRHHRAVFTPGTWYISLSTLVNFVISVNRLNTNYGQWSLRFSLASTVVEICLEVLITTRWKIISNRRAPFVAARNSEGGIVIFLTGETQVLYWISWILPLSHFLLEEI